LIAVLAAVPGCGRPSFGAQPVARSLAPLRAQASPEPVVAAGLAIVILDDDWTRFRLDIFEEDHEEPAADCTFEAVFQVDPTAPTGLLKVTRMESVRQRGKLILRREGEALPVFDRTRVAALAHELARCSVAIGFPNGLSVASHLRILLMGRVPPQATPADRCGRPAADGALPGPSYPGVASNNDLDVSGIGHRWLKRIP
jgi:hypothetical protein